MLRRAIPPSSDRDELTRLQARVDQVLALVTERATSHSANRDLVDLALDVANTLRPQTRKPSPRSR